MDENEKQIDTTFIPPKSIIAQSRLDRFANIASHIAYTCLILLGITSITSFIMPLFQAMLVALAYLLGIIFCGCMIFFSLGLVFLDTEGTFGKIWEFFTKIGSMDGTMNFANICFYMIKIFSIIGIVGASISILFMILQRKRKYIGTIIGLSIIIIIFVFALIIFNAMGGVLWQSF